MAKMSDDTTQPDPQHSPGDERDEQFLSNTFEDVSPTQATIEGMEIWDVEGLKAPLEAILMVIDQPVGTDQLAEVLEADDDLVERALQELQDEYEGRDASTPEHRHRTTIRPRGFRLRNVAGGWRIYSAPQWADLVGRFLIGNTQSKLSPAALETLAVVAYRQPVSRSHISQIRGVNVDAVVRTLVNRGLIEEVDESATGAHLYGTTPLFLERMNMKSLDELLPLAPYLPQRDQLEELEETL